MSHMNLINLREHSAALLQRRNKAAVVLYPKITEQRNYAQQLASAVGWPHFDLLNEFSEKADLTDQLVAFSMSDFFDYLKQQKSSNGIVVSNIEIVLTAWIAQGTPVDIKNDFCSRVELWERSPALLIVTQNDPVFANYQPTRHTDSRLIMKTSDTLALE